MDNNAIRKRVKEAYPYPKWYKRVDNMSDAQVYATFRRLVSKGVIKN